MNPYTFAFMATEAKSIKLEFVEEKHESVYKKMENRR